MFCNNQRRLVIICCISILLILRQGILASDQLATIRLPDRLVEAGKDFIRTCSVAWGKSVNFTLPVDPSGYIAKLSRFNDRKMEIHEKDRDGNMATSTMIVRNASVLDTGSYGCILVENNQSKMATLFNVEYIFVHPPLRHHSNDLDSIDTQEIVTEDLLLPALDVYVWEEGQTNQKHQIIPLKPTHPDVSFRCSRKKNGHLIEIFSTEYKAPERDIWSWDKYRGLVANSFNVDRAKGVYWCDATLGGWKTSRFFRIFVIPRDIRKSRDGVDDDVPRIKKAVEYLIYPSGRSFQLTCQIAIEWNVTWIVPSSLDVTRYTVQIVTDTRFLLSTLRVPETRYSDTGNYTCLREDARHLFANQYVFVSDAAKLMLPTESSYVFNDSQRALLPCRPTHPDVVVSLQRPGLTGRGMENITLYPKDGQEEWDFTKFSGFRSKVNATRAVAGPNICHAVRNNVEVTRFFRVLVAELKMGYIHDSGPVVVDGDEITIKCQSYGAPANVTWRPSVSGQSGSTLRNSSSRRIYYTQGSKLYTMELTWHNITKSASGIYECRYDGLLRNVTVAQYHMIVHDARAPKVAKIKDEAISLVETKEGKMVKLACHLEQLGAPAASVNWTWIKDGVVVDLPTKERPLHLENGSSVLEFRAESSSEGEYTCQFENRVGVDQRTFQLAVVWEDDSLVAVIVVLVIIAAILVIVARIFYVRFSRTRIAPDVAKVLEPLLAGNPERINRHLPLDGQSELLPYDARWEFSRDRLKLGKQLGSGCFGRVLKAEADGIVEPSLNQTVAVKMIRSYADLGALASLVSELKILIHLGSHVNIVNLLGACTDVTKGDFLVIVEYCRYGNLLSALLANRHLFVDQIDDHGNLAPLCGTQNIGYMNMVAPTKSLELLCQESGNTDYLVMLSAAGDSSAKFQPVDEETQVLSSLTTRDLVCWSFQIARGMDYLSGRNVIHGDLAARNILLADSGVAKIADFGLSRKVYEDSNYKKKGTAMLPVKWMALESLTDRVFSSQSDVWAFGVTVWELFSLGKAPYPDMEELGTLIHQLENGVRMEMPRSSPSTVTRLVSHCWEADPANRPSFAQLEETLAGLMEESVRKFYIDANEPYHRRNIERFGILDKEATNDEPSAKRLSARSGYVNM